MDKSPKGDGTPEPDCESPEPEGPAPGRGDHRRRWLRRVVRIGTGATVLIRLYITIRDSWPE
ncbi:hypothetical protein GCM10009555_015560 [Acrocarpospora macrocephala]|uniref:Uncharacterized protein n=1 Tax=Acrocarpospora macrocephala TaxID=150177 RepID=A0A5M3WXK2_9ACTN|nr:hypothetical protein Amac_077940 [Acrocarpospora macrocephala]